jgi:hypothetical protein
MSQIRAKQIRSNNLGDLLVGNSTNNFEIIGIGSTGEVLTVNGGTATWALPAVPSAFVYRGTVNAADPLLPQVSSFNASLAVQDVTYTAVASGTGGNNISITYTTGGTAGSEVVTVVGNAISVQIQSGASTAADIAAAIAASAPAAALVTTVANTPAAFETAPFSTTYLAGGRVLEAGDFYVVIATGNTENFAGTWDANSAPPYVGSVFLSGDDIVFNGTKWDKFDNNQPVVAGTAGEISVSYAPLTETYTVSIDTSYTGQSTITTVGTITSGAWNGTPIPRQFGGTGNDTTSLAANQIFVASTSTTTTGIVAPTVSGTFLEWNGSTFVWAAATNDAFSTIAGNSGSVTASGPTTINIVGDLGITTVAAAGSPDTLTIGTSITSGSALVNNVGVGSNQLGIRGATAGTLLQATGLSTEADWTTFTLPTSVGSAGTILISDGTNIITSTLTLPNTVTAPSALVANTNNTVTAAPASSAGQVLMYNGSTVGFGTLAYSDLSGTPQFGSDEFIIVTPTANQVMTNFFSHTPLAGSVVVFFNGLRLQNTGWSISAGTTLTLADSVNGYSTDANDQITANYSF